MIYEFILKLLFYEYKIIVDKKKFVFTVKSTSVPSISLASNLEPKSTFNLRSAPLILKDYSLEYGREFFAGQHVLMRSLNSFINDSTTVKLQNIKRRQKKVNYEWFKEKLVINGRQTQIPSTILFVIYPSYRLIAQEINN